MGPQTLVRARPIHYPIIAVLLAVAMLATSSLPPAPRLLPKATAAYLGLMDHLGLLEADPASPVGVRPAVPSDMAEGLPVASPEGERFLDVPPCEVRTFLPAGPKPGAAARHRALPIAQ